MVTWRIGLVASALVLMAAPLASAEAAPPPPPPSYVSAVADLLTREEDATTITKLSGFVADDVRAYLNGKLVADGKARWASYYAAARRSPGRLVAYSAGWEANGTLMIVDQYDTVDRSKLPAGFVADPRPISRATLYQVGPDHKIHAIRTLIGGQFWIRL